jgi:hypothetical protein
VDFMLVAEVVVATWQQLQEQAELAVAVLE